MIDRVLSTGIAKACVSHLWSVLDKERIMFNCDERYVDSDDPNLCYNTMPYTSSKIMEIFVTCQFYVSFSRQALAVDEPKFN